MLVSTVSPLVKRTVFLVFLPHPLLSRRTLPILPLPSLPTCLPPLSFHFSTLLLLLLASPQVSRGLERKSLLSRDEGSVTKYWQDGEVGLRGKGVYKYRFSSQNLYPPPNDTSCGNLGTESSTFCCVKGGRKS